MMTTTAQLVEELGEVVTSGWPTPVQEHRGLCFVYAFKFVDQHAGWTLCHGILTGIAVGRHDADYWHGWAVKGTLLYEPLAHRIFDREHWRVFTRPTKVRRYSRNDARRSAFVTENYGPWHG